MSLNGLEDPKVVEAHEAAAAEPGGWLLLQYASRDEIELLNSGNGGIVEVRNTIARYEEESPLYGFLRYRRRNVIIKYLPEGCSRLIQARVAVHFNAVCERFSPYNTTFEISTASELKDSKLSAACSLHAASGSTSSSTSSLRRRRLMEIAEEDEEEQRATKRQSLVPDTDSERPKTPIDNISTTDQVTLNSDLASSPEHSKFSAASTSEVPTFVGFNEDPTSPARSFDANSTHDSYAYSSYSSIKPKVKLGPRPSFDTAIRPQTAGNFRPVSSIPAGFKLFGKGGKKGKGKDGSSVTSQDDIPEMDASDVASFAVEDAANEDADAITIIDIAPTASPAKPIVSPEKARLMKAMQLREKKKKKLAAATAALKTKQAPEAENEPIDSFANTEGEVDALESDAKDDHQQIIEISDGHEMLHGEDDSNGGRMLSLAQGDSGVAFDAASSSLNTDKASETTKAESSAESPIMALSELEPSTAESSLSESTEEIAQSKSEGYLDGLSDGALDLSTSEKGDQLVPSTSQVKKSLGSTQHDTAETHVAPNNTCVSEQTNVMGGNAGELLDIGKDSERLDVLAAEYTPDRPTGEGEPASPRLMVPKSKFSTQDLKSVNISSSLSDSKREVGIDASRMDEELEVVANHDDEAAKTSTESITKPVVSPINTNLAHHAMDSEPDLSEDEKLMEELHVATVQEAKPMVVAKSPVTPIFPSPTVLNAAASSTAPRTVSNPVRGNLSVPSDGTQAARSLSTGAAFLHKVTQQQQNNSNLSAKPNVGSSISQRIKALEMLSANAGDQSRPASRERPSSTFFSVQKRETSRSPSVVDRTLSFKQGSPSAEPQKDSSPDNTGGLRKRSPSVVSRLSKFESSPSQTTSGGLTAGGLPRGRPESISVTAKILRDPNNTHGLDQSKDAPEYSFLDLKQSPLVVDHHSISPDGQEYEYKDEQKRSLGFKSFIKEGRKSVDIQQPPSRPSSSNHQNNTGHRLSISSRRSSISKDRDNILLPSAINPEGEDGKSSGDKVMSRAGRFMRRLSNFSGARGKNAAPSLAPPVVEEIPQTADKRQAVARPTPAALEIMSDLGDVNVQFPDNLLWKRRNLCLDSQGFLILSALPVQNARPAQGTKRYHLSEFRQPYLPDVEIQELPNSVVLDFVEGAGIQMACEDRAGQMHVLQTLRDAHANHVTFGK